MSSINKSKRVAVFFWDGWISVSPSIINTLLLLHTKGYIVDCITRQTNGNLAEDVIFPEDINIFRLSNGIVSKKQNHANQSLPLNPDLQKESKVVKQTKFKKISWYLKRNVQLFLQFYYYLKFSKKIVKDKKYDIVVGVDSHGLAAAGLIFLLNKIPLLYFSLEIKFLNEFKYFVERLIKRLERYFHSKSKFVIIQDKYRLQALCDENKVNINDNFVIVPNGPMGKYHKYNSSFFKDKFNFSDTDTIVLHAGGLSSGYMTDEIATSSANWSDDFKLVFHFSGFMDENSSEIEKLKLLSKNKAYYSTTPVPFDKLAEITSSANIGIAFYNKDRDLNHTLIVGASGKMANYFRCGIPVIALNLPGFKELFDEYRCGVVIESTDQCQQAIEIIKKDYPRFCQNAIKCYEEVYEFEVHFNKALYRIETILKS